MNLTLHLTPETEAKLIAQAALAGKQPEELVLEVLQEQLSSEPVLLPQLSNDDWLRLFDDWVINRPSRNPLVDDSRDSMYPDRA